MKLSPEHHARTRPDAARVAAEPMRATENSAWTGGTLFFAVRSVPGPAGPAERTGLLRIGALSDQAFGQVFIRAAELATGPPQVIPFGIRCELWLTTHRTQHNVPVEGRRAAPLEPSLVHNKSKCAVAMCRS